MAPQLLPAGFHFYFSNVPLILLLGFPLLSMEFLFSFGCFPFLFLVGPLVSYWVPLCLFIGFSFILLLSSHLSSIRAPYCDSIGPHSFCTVSPLFSNGPPFVFGVPFVFRPMCLPSVSYRVSVVCFALLLLVFLHLVFYCFLLLPFILLLGAPLFSTAPPFFLLGSVRFPLVPICLLFWNIVQWSAGLRPAPFFYSLQPLGCCFNLREICLAVGVLS